MGGTRLEQPAFLNQNQGSSQDSNKSGAKYGAVINDFVKKYPELQKIISSWPELPEQVKTTIVELIEKPVLEKR
jgi:hypothetical protein